MAVPKRRHSNARTNSRRANHDKKEPRHLTYCVQCSSAVPRTPFARNADITWVVKSLTSSHRPQ